LRDPVLDYAKAVLSGEIVAGPHVRASCQRHINDLKRKDIVWSLADADYAIGFFPNVLRLSEGQFEGIPFSLDPSQAFIVGSIFGWKRKNGTRRFRRAYLELAKGNGKSPLAAGIGLFGMLSDNEPGAQIYAGGAKKSQADIFKPYNQFWCSARLEYGGFEIRFILSAYISGKRQDWIRPAPAYGPL